MRAKATTSRAGGSGAGVFPSRVWFSAPAAGSRVDAFQGVVAKLLAVVALGSLVEAEATFQTVGGGKGRQAGLLSKVLCFWAGDGDDNGGGSLACSLGIRGEPSGLLCKREPSVESAELLANVG